MNDRPVEGGAFDADVRGQSVEMKSLDAGSVNTDAWEWDLRTTPAGPVMRLRAPYVLDATRSTYDVDYVSVSSTPYNMTAGGRLRVYLCTTGASNLVFNLPAASTMTSSGPVYIVKVDTGAGVVQVAPNGSDAFSGGIGNASVYLPLRGNYVAVSGTASGLLALVDGLYEPAHATDTNGTQYNWGRYRHLPLSNTTSRSLYGAAPPAAAAYSSAVSGTGVVGVPAGAVAVRVRVEWQLSSTAGGTTTFRLALTDNNSNTPGVQTAHPSVTATWTAAGASSLSNGSTELDLPLNASGQFYLYTITATNLSVAFQTVYVTALGYYMGV